MKTTKEWACLAILSGATTDTKQELLDGQAELFAAAQNEAYRQGYKDALVEAATFYATHRRDTKGVLPRHHEMTESEQLFAEAIRSMPIPFMPKESK